MKSKSMNRIIRVSTGVFQTMDKWTWLIALGLSILSILLLIGIYESGYVQVRTVQVQAIAIAIGAIGALIAAQFDPEDLAGLWRLYVPPVVLLMILTYFIGTAREGTNNRSWLNFSFFSIQPSEFLKIAFILTFAIHLSRVGDDLNAPRSLIPVLIHGLIPAGMVLLQGDAGVALILFCIMAAMLFAAGLSIKYIVAALGSLMIVAPIGWFLLSDYQRNRFLALFNPEADPLGINFQQNRGITALGSGQIFGIGIFKEGHIYVPDNYNDFVFTFLGESLGFIGCFFALLAIAILCGKILHTGVHSHTIVGRMICAGVFAMIAFQVIINVGMCLRLLPVIGITLPLLSGGGSSVLAVYAGIGLVMSVYADNHKSMFGGI